VFKKFEKEEVDKELLHTFNLTTDEINNKIADLEVIRYKYTVDTDYELFLDVTFMKLSKQERGYMVHPSLVYY
jgi:hypothetical protein